MATVLKTIQINENEKMTLEEKIIHGTYTKKILYIFPKTYTFSFPLRQISSIRYSRETDISRKQVVFSLILIIGGFFAISTYVTLGLILILVGGFFLYKNFKPESGIKILTSGGDSQIYPLGNIKENDAKEFVELSNEQISKI